jgi:transaldolase
MTNPLAELRNHGQSVWLDSLSRDLLDSGRLAEMIATSELSGVTSNPTIFHDAIVGSTRYRSDIEALAGKGLNAIAIYRALTTEDIRRAADLLRPVYDDTEGRDGFVSLEVSPLLADDAHGTVVEALELWAALDRSNVMIKVPGTNAGLKAIHRLIAEGINVNVTLLFGIPRYRAVAEAYLAGIEDRLRLGQPVSGIASVASFFLSRIDVLVDQLLAKHAAANPADAEGAARLTGRTAIASAKLAYQAFKRDIIGGERFGAVAAAGARPQRLLWASTGTKNPAYSDTKYIEPLVGPDTINTMPPPTLAAYRDHGRPAVRLEQDVGEAQEDLARLADLGISLEVVTQRLEGEGKTKFVEPYVATIKALEEAIGRASRLGSQASRIN